MGVGLREGEGAPRPSEPGSEGEGGCRLTPKYQLCPDDLAWYSGLMQTLSASLQGHSALDLPGL